MTEIRVSDLGQDCAICLETMDSPSNVNYVNCGHIFHRACIEEWNQRNGTCPLDQGRITQMGALQIEEAPVQAQPAQPAPAQPAPAPAQPAPVQAQPAQPAPAPAQPAPAPAPAQNKTPKRMKFTAADFFKQNSFGSIIKQQQGRSGTKPQQRCGRGQETMAQHINKRRNHCHAGSRC